jgi:hypothetical protein
LGVQIDNKARTEFEIAEALRLESCYIDLAGYQPSRGTVDLGKKGKPAQLMSGLQNTKPDNFPVFNNIPGRGHGFNGLCSLPSKPDCLFAPTPIQPAPQDPYSNPIILSSLGSLPQPEPLTFPDVQHLFPAEINFS